MPKQKMNLTEFLDTEIYPNIDAEVLFEDYDPRDRGRYYQLVCPECGEREAFYYKGGFGLKCNRGNACAYEETLIEFAAGKERPRGKEFVDALKMLANAAGVSLPATERSEKEFQAIQDAEVRKSILSEVIAYSQAILSQANDTHAKKYIEDRGLAAEDIRRFRLGYYAKASDLEAHLIAKGFSTEEIKATKVISQRNEGYIVVPWFDASSAPLTLYFRWTDKNPINMKDHPGWLSERNKLFKKHCEKMTDKPWEEPKIKKMLALSGEGSKSSPFCFNLAVESDQKELVLVEGLFDALVLQAKGDSRVVACMGSQISKAQASTLKKYGVHSVIIALDPDAAGEKSVAPCIQTLADNDIAAFVAPELPVQCDPDEYVNHNGIGMWKQQISLSEHGLTHLARKVLSQHHVSGEWSDREKKNLLVDAVHAVERIRGTKVREELDLYFWPLIQRKTNLTQEEIQAAIQSDLGIEHEGKSYRIKDDKILIERSQGKPCVFSPVRFKVVEEIQTIGLDGSAISTKLVFNTSGRRFQLNSTELADGRVLVHRLNDLVGVNACLTPYAAITVFGLEKLISKPIQTKRRSHAGYYKENGEHVYLSGRLKVTKGSIIESDVSFVDDTCEGSSKYLGMTKLTPDELKRVWNDIIFGSLLQIKDLSYTGIFLAVAIVPIIADLIDEKAPIIVIHGQSATLKSTFLRFLMCFYGSFYKSNTLISASSTANSIEKQASFFRGSPVPIDDVKTENMRKSMDRFVSVFQNYFDGTSKGRLKSNIDSQPQFPIHGMPVLAAEDHPWKSVNSLNGRTAMIDWPSDAPNLAAATRVENAKELLTGSLPPLIQSLIMEGQDALRTQFMAVRDEYLKRRDAVPNAVRLAQNFSIIDFAWKKLTDWLAKAQLVDGHTLQEGNQAFEEGLKRAEVSNLDVIRESHYGETFLRILRDLISTRKVRLQETIRPPGMAKFSLGHLSDSDRNIPLIGYTSQSTPDRVYILPMQAVAAANQLMRDTGETSNMNAGNIGADLHALGYLVERGKEKLVKQIEVGIGKPTVWVVKRDVLLGAEAPSMPFGPIQTHAMVPMPSFMGFTRLVPEDDDTSGAYGDQE